MPTGSTADLRTFILGEFALAVGDRRTYAPVGRHAEILAVLTLSAGRPLSAARIVEQVWAPEPPDNAVARLHVHISRIRRLLNSLGCDDVLTRRHDGYLLDVDHDKCDHRLFGDLVACGADALRCADPVTASGLLEQALGLWRGPVLGNLCDRPWAQPEVTRLTGLRGQAVEMWAEALLALDRPAEVVGVLETALRDDPLRERMAEFLMIALYRTGRQADALNVYARTRATLSEDLGIEPSPPLQAAYLAILHHDPGVAAPDARDRLSAAGNSRADTPHVSLPTRIAPLLGREAQLQAIDRAADEAVSTPVRFVVLVGMGGVGKSRLALEYAYHACATARIVWWIPAAEPVGLVEALSRLAASLGVGEHADQPIMLSRLWRELRRRDDWVLVYDDCADPDVLLPLRPTGGGGLVLVTSRHRAWGNLGRPLVIDALKVQDSVRLLGVVSGAAHTDAATELAEQLGGLPLALVQASAFIEQTGMTLERYLELFRSQRLALMSRATPEDHRAGVATTWQLSVEQVAASSTPATEVLRLCAALGTAEIPLELLASASGLLTEPLRSVVTDQLTLEDTIAVLLRFSLVYRDGQSLRMHPLMRAVLQAQLTHEERERDRIGIDQILHAAMPGAADDPAEWPRWAWWVPHALDLAERHEAAHDQARAVPLLLRAGEYLDERALYRTAREVLERAERSATLVWGPADRRLVPVLSELGLVLERLGDNAGSRTLQERALALLEAAGEQSGPDAGRVLTRLGAVLRCQRDLVAAMHAQRRALAALDPTSAPHEYGRCLTDLGLSQWMAGQLGQARATFDDAIALLDGCLGPLHPDVAHAKSGQAVVFQDLGLLEDARDLQAGVLACVTSTMGNNHPDTAHALDKYAYLSRLLGQLDESIRGHQQAIDILASVYGQTHVEVAMPLTNLGLVHRMRGDLEVAAECQQRAMELFAATYGAQHPHTALATRRLGGVRIDQGRQSEAEQLLEQALTLTIAGLGPDHPDVQATREELAACRSALVAN